MSVVGVGVLLDDNLLYLNTSIYNLTVYSKNILVGNCKKYDNTYLSTVVSCGVSLIKWNTPPVTEIYTWMRAKTASPFANKNKTRTEKKNNYCAPSHFDLLAVRVCEDTKWPCTKRDGYKLQFQRQDSRWLVSSPLQLLLSSNRNASHFYSNTYVRTNEEKC